jgi:transposase, IS30 family
MQTSPRHYQQLQPENRVTMACLLQQNHSLRPIAAVLKRSPSTISWERHQEVVSALRTAAASPHTSATAQRSCQKPRRASSPLALIIVALYPKGNGYRVSTETIYNCICAQPVGERKRELVACLRHAQNKRMPRSKGQDRRGQIPDMLSIHIRPPELEDRRFLAHWEGNLIKRKAQRARLSNAPAVWAYDHH